MTSYPLFANRYELLKQLAVGGMGEIFLARDRQASNPESRIVVKRILQNMAADSNFVTMFLDEARITIELRHANIVEVYEADESEGRCFLTMEYLPGHNLSQIMARAIQVLSTAICPPETSW